MNSLMRFAKVLIYGMTSFSYLCLCKDAFRYHLESGCQRIAFQNPPLIYFITKPMLSSPK